MFWKCFIIIASLYLRGILCQNETQVEKSLCEAKEYDWKCCTPTTSFFNRSLTVCAAVQYLKKNIGVNMTVSINDFIAYNDEISLRNPPPICFDVPIPHLDKLLAACVRFTNLDTNNLERLTGCIRFDGRVLAQSIVKIKIGCFKFDKEPGEKPPTQEVATFQEEMYSMAPTSIPKPPLSTTSQPGPESS